MYDSYQNTSKEKLLEFMKDAPDIERLKTLSQKELAQRYCEACAVSITHEKEIREAQAKAEKTG